MNDRQRFVETMTFGTPDRVPYWENVRAWEETLERWHAEAGFPKEITLQDQAGWKRFDEYFGFDKREEPPIIWNGPFPPLGPRVIEETDEHQIVVDEYGVQKRVAKDHETMPQFMRFPVTNKDDFLAIKERYQVEGRYPKNWPGLVAQYKQRDYPLYIPIIGYFGQGRYWMGIEEFSVAFHTQPDFIHTMFEFWMDFQINLWSRAVKDVQFDYALIWEDMAYKTGPLLSPEMVREFMLPYYKKITSFLKSNGVNIILVDSDGNVDKLLPLFIEGGITGCYPFEVQAGMDITEVRDKFGTQLSIIGGIDKRALSQGPKAIKNEVYNKVPHMLEQGGYIPSLDHAIPPEVSLEQYTFYLKTIREVCGIQSTSTISGCS